MAENVSSWSYAREKKLRFISPEANVRFPPFRLSLSLSSPVPRLVQRITSSKLETRALVPLFEIYVCLSTVTRLVTRKNRSLRPLNARSCRMYGRIARYSTPSNFFPRHGAGTVKNGSPKILPFEILNGERIGGERTNERTNSVRDSF